MQKPVYLCGKFCNMIVSKKLASQVQFPVFLEQIGRTRIIEERYMDYYSFLICFNVLDNDMDRFASFLCSSLCHQNWMWMLPLTKNLCRISD